MAIKYTNTKGSVIEFDTVEEFQAFVNAYKSEDANAEVDMENLPIGTLVKVVDNSAGHCHDAGEILPITEVNEGILDELYRLDGRSVGWVAVEDIEFVSFPEEEESTSGNEEDPDLGFKNGDYAKVLKSNVIFNDDDVIKILDAEGDGHSLAEREDGVDGYAIASQLMKIDKPSGNGDEEVDKDGGFEVGDKAEVISLYSMFTKGEEIVIVEQTGDGVPLARNESGEEWYISDDKIKKIGGEGISHTNLLEVGDILRCNKDSMYVTEGKLYEVLAIDRDGDAVYMDDGNSVSYVNETDIPERFEIL